MKFIEAEGLTFAHISVDEVSSQTKLKALCLMKPFPWDFEVPVQRTKPICRRCLSLVRR